MRPKAIMTKRYERIVLAMPYRSVRKTETTDYNALKPPWIAPLGIGYISSFLKQHGYEPKILDCLASPEITLDKTGRYLKMGLTEDRIRSFLKRERPEVVGISSNFTPGYMDALELAAITKDVDRDIKVVIGGAHATMDYVNMISDPNVDVVVRGEGEYTFLEYVENPERTDILSTVIKVDGRVTENPPRPVIENLDALPFPDYDALDMNFYLGLTKKGFVSRLANDRIGSIVSSRGCLYNCIFCSTCKVFKKFRGRSAKNVVDEIELLVKKYRIEELTFQDDCFLASRKRVVEICMEMIRRRIKVRWSSPPGLNVCLLDREILEIMTKSGLYRANLPIETGSPRTLKFIRKPVELNKAREIIAECNRLGIWNTANFMIGFPYETKEEIDQTAQYIYKSDLDAAAVLICQPYDGSDLYDIYKQEGLFSNRPDRGSTGGTTTYDTKHFKAEELNMLRRQMLNNFFNIRIRSFLTPRGVWVHILKKINTPAKFAYFLKKLLRGVVRYDIIGIITKKGSSPFLVESNRTKAC